MQNSEANGVDRSDVSAVLSFAFDDAETPRDNSSVNESGSLQSEQSWQIATSTATGQQVITEHEHATRHCHRTGGAIDCACTKGWVPWTDRKGSLDDGSVEAKYC